MKIAVNAASRIAVRSVFIALCLPPSVDLPE
jgi:hypothetical protein